MELGAGTGAASMIAAVEDAAMAERAGDGAVPLATVPWRFLATDMPLAMPHCERCVARNGLGHAVRTQALQWGDAGHAAAARVAVAALRVDLAAAASTLAIPAAAAATATVAEPVTRRETAAAAPAAVSPGLPDLLVASDLAAPLASVGPLLATLAAFMSPPPPPLQPEGAADAWLATALETWLTAAPPPALPPLPHPGAPFLLITCQVAREFTAALLPALRAAGYGVALLPPAGLDPAFESPRHETYAVAAPPPLA